MSLNLEIKDAEERTSLFLGGILKATKEKLKKIKNEKGYKTYAALIDALFKD